MRLAIRKGKATEAHARAPRGQNSGVRYIASTTRDGKSDRQEFDAKAKEILGRRVCISRHPGHNGSPNDVLVVLDLLLFEPTETDVSGVMVVAPLWSYSWTVYQGE
jgi:hypothetical protein